MYESLQVQHLVALDGSDRGSSAITIGPDGMIESVEQTPSQPGGREELTAIPLLADSHAHLGISDGLRDAVTFHNVPHIERQLRTLARFGTGHVHSLGTDQRWLTQRLNRRLAAAEPARGAYGYSAGVGFGAVDGWPPELTTPELRFRPQDPALARAAVQDMAELGCRTLKIWVDDFDGTVPKTPIGIAEAIVDEAHRAGLRTFAHVKYHQDAEALVGVGVDVLAHSVRDGEMQDDLLERMAITGIFLVPTLSRDEAEYLFSAPENPYLASQFFIDVAGPRRFEALTTESFSSDPVTPSERLRIALANVKKAHDFGVRIGLGTDSGFRMKILGFAQHRELELLRLAGLSPEACFQSALENNQLLFASRMTAIAAQAPASFFVVRGNPYERISDTQNIHQVWLNGEKLIGSPEFTEPAP
jgi:hypothetical protein